MKARGAVLFALLCALAVVLGAAPPAEAKGDRSRIVLRADASGTPGAPVELAPDGLDRRGSFIVENAGDFPVRIERVEVRTSAEDPRTPPGVSAEMERSAEATLKPGERRKVTVRWRTASARARELYGHVRVIADPPAGGAAPPAMGIHAERGRGLGWIGDHALSLLALLPLLGAIGAALARRARALDEDRLRILQLAVRGAGLALALWVYARFDAGLGREAGNDGLQFIERGALLPSLGLEYFVGVDGFSVSLVLLTALVALVATAAGGRRAGSPLVDVAIAGMYGVFIAQDLLLFAAAWAVMLVPLASLIRAGGTPEQRGAGSRLLRVALVSSALLVASALWMRGASDPGYLVDGSFAARTAALPELARVAWVAKGLTLFGLPAVKVIWVALFLAFALILPIVPLHGWLPDAQPAARPEVRVLLAGGALAAAGYGLLRVNAGLLPEATRWAAPAMAAIGALTIVGGALLALAQRDLCRLLAHASVSQMGFVLLGLGALTPQGIQAAAAQLSLHGLIAALLFATASAVEERARTRGLDQLGGILRGAPWLAALSGLGLVASMGVPGLSGFWGEALAILGAMPRWPLLALVAALGLVLGAAVHLAALRALFRGGERSEAREASGDAWDLRGPEIAAAAPIAALVVLLGLWPRPLLEPIDRAALELHRRLDPPAPTQIAMAGPRRNGYGVAHAHG